MSQLEQDAKHALETFLAAITNAAQRAAIEAIHTAFVRIPTLAGHPGAVPDYPVTGPKELAPRRALARTDPAAVRARIVACICAHPGSTIMELARSLGIDRWRLARQLRALIDNGAIRSNERGGSRGPRREYFVVDAANAASKPAEPLAAPTGASDFTAKPVAVAVAVATRWPDRRYHSSSDVRRDAV